MNYKKYISALILCSAYLVGFAQDGSDTSKEFPTLGYGDNTLDEGTYNVLSDVTLDMNSDNSSKPYRGAAIKIKKGKKVAITIPLGRTLTLVGSNASQRDSTRAYPAIELPSGSTLIIKGAGTLIATGGQGDDKESYGRQGGNGDYSCHHWAKGGPGGEGGVGGYGSAPGIGTPGGLGGKGGKCEGNALCPEALENNRMNGKDRKSGNGSNGESTSQMGCLIVLGSVTIKSTAGTVPQFTQKEANYGQSTFDEHNRSARNYYSCGSGGGGGQGGAAIRAVYGIGAGAPGAGGGGAGGSGGVDEEYYRRHLTYFNGHGGEGGKSTKVNGANGKREAGYEDGGALGGNGGKCGNAGGNGNVYYSISSTFSAEGMTCISKEFATCLDDMSENDIMKLLPNSEIHKMYKAKWGEKQSLNFYNGMQLSGDFSKVNVPQIVGTNSEFAGYADQYGNQIYDSSGNLSIVKNADFFPYIKTVDGKWFINSDADIELSTVFTNRVRLYVNHYIEDPNFKGGDNLNCYSSHAPIFSEYKEYVIREGEPLNLTLKAFHDIDGNLICFDKDGNDSLYYSALGDANVILDGTQSIVKASLIYDRKTYQLEWDYNNILSEEQFDALLENRETYTHSGMVKYGQEVVAPKLRRFGNKDFVYWEDEQTGSKLEGTMPATSIKAIPMVSTATYLISQQIDQTDTECDITCNKLTGIEYQEPVNVLVHFVGDTRLSNLSVTDNQTGDTLAFTWQNDSLFTFLMPGSDVTVNARFVRAHYKLVSSISNKYATKVAIKDPKGIYYTDDNDYFHFADTLVGGGLDDLAVYQGERITIIPEIDQSMIETDEQEYEFRPIVQVHKGNDKYDDHTWDKNEIYGGRVFRSYVYDITEAKETHIKVVWTKRVNKKITICRNDDSEHYANITEMFTDAKPDVFCQDSMMACYNDIVCFAVETNDTAFNDDNIAVFYCDPANPNDSIFVPVRTAGSVDGSGKMYYQFLMPGRNTIVMLNTGRKVPLNSSIQTGDYFGNARYGDTIGDDYEYIPAYSENARGYRVIMPEYGVVGCKVPYFIFKTTAPNDIHNPVAVYDVNKAAKPTGFGYYSDEHIDEDKLYGQGSFIVPDTEGEVDLKNGVITSFNPGYLWFSVYNAEAISLPYWLKAFTVVAHPDHTFEMSQIFGDAVPKNCAVVISIDPEWLEEFMGATDQSSMFLDTDPNIEDVVMNENDLRGVSCECTCGELSDSLFAESGRDYDIYLMQYDPTTNVVSFVIAPYDNVVYPGMAYLPVLRDGNEQPIYPVGINTPEIASQMPTSDKAYSITGVQVSSDYNGIVIRNGKKVLQLNFKK